MEFGQARKICKFDIIYVEWIEFCKIHLIKSWLDWTILCIEYFFVIDICKKILTGSFTPYFSFSPLSRWSFYCFLPLLTQNTFFIFFLFEFREFPGNNLKMFMLQFLDPNIAWNVFYFISFITNKILGMDYNRSLNLLHEYINFYYFSTPECFCYDACLSLLCFITRALQSK